MKTAKLRAVIKTVEVDMSWVLGEEGVGFEVDVLANPPHAMFQRLQDSPYDPEAQEDFVRQMVRRIDGLDGLDGQPITSLEGMDDAERIDPVMRRTIVTAIAQAIQVAMEAMTTGPKLSVR